MGTRFSALGKAPRRMSALLGRLRSFDGPASNSLPGPPRPLDRLAVKVLLLLFEQREARVIFRHYPRGGYCNRLQRQKRDQFPLAPRDQARGDPFLSRRDGDLVGVLSLNAIPEARSPGCAPRSAFPCVASEKPRRFFLFSPTPGQASRGHIMPVPMSPEARQPWSLAPTGLSRAAPALQGCARTIAQWIIFLWRGLSRPGRPKATPCSRARLMPARPIHRCCCRNATFGGAQLLSVTQHSHEIAAEIVIIHLDHVPGRAVKVPMRRFAANPRGDILRTRQSPGNLQRGDTRLMVGEPPDAYDRLKQPDEKQILDHGMHHLQVERRRPGRIPVHN